MNITPSAEEIVQGRQASEAESIVRARRQDTISRIMIEVDSGSVPPTPYGKGLLEGRKSALETHSRGEQIQPWPVAPPSPVGGSPDPWSEGYRTGQAEIKGLFQ